MKNFVLRLIIVALALGTAVVWFKVYYAFKHPTLLYRKDFIQFYLMAKAEKAGLSVYTPLGDLARQFDPNLANFHQHPSAYPPTIMLLVWPLAELSYMQALLLWDSFEVLCYAVAAALIIRHFRKRANQNVMVIVILMCVIWPPFFYDLRHGQIMMTILLLLTGLWLALSSGRRVLAGVLLGLLFALKLYAWPVALLLLLKRNFKPVFVAGAVFLTLNGIVLVWLGHQTFIQYVEVVREINLIYRTHPLNFSVLAQASDYFGPAVGFAIAGLLLAFSLFLALRSPDFDHAFMIMTAATVILTPVSWDHYMVTLVPALCVVVSWTNTQLPEKILIGTLFYFAVPEVYYGFAPRPFVRLVPVLFVIALMVLLSRQLRSAQPAPAYG